MAIADRLAGAPISWGVCEVPDWGWQPDPALDPVPEIELARVGITATLQPHVGTLVETADDVGRVLAGSGIGLCLATGHLLIGGADPVSLAAEHAGRIRHTHLEDVDASWARRVQSGEVSYTDAVRGGMYRPLGQGDVDIAAIVGSLERAGYDGWYVLEQDMILTGPPAIGHDATGDDAAGHHPIDEPEGVLARTRDERFVAEPFPVEVVNRLGAGDAFGGALCHGLLARWPMERVLRFANVAGAIVASRLECSTAMPTVGEVEDRMGEQRATSGETAAAVHVAAGLVRGGAS